MTLDSQTSSGKGPRRTAYAVAIENRAKAIQEALGVCHYDACLERIEQIRTYADHLEMEIKRERAANPHHVSMWRMKGPNEEVESDAA